jgi:hypothetical protein
MQASLKALSALAVVAATITLPAQAVQRTFVASFGNDANTATSCGFANPCRGFTAAQGVTDPNGEIVALDAAGYGTITITKSITLTANPGFYAGIAASSGNAVTIATAGVNVILRGLNINSLGAARGVSMTDGSSLTIENCVISNFNLNNTSAGVLVSAPARLKVVDSLIRGNFNGISLDNGADAAIANVKLLGNTGTSVFLFGQPNATITKAVVSDSIITGPYVGVYGSASGTATVRISVTRSTVSGHLYGVASESAGTTITLSNSMVIGNTTGLFQQGATSFRSLGNNTVDQNTINVDGTVTPISGT